MQLKQYIDDMAPSKKQQVLRKKDMELIIEARNRLLADLIKPPTIRELAKLTGTNENKLKKGFRLLYNTSINKLLQNERLSKAKLLIAEEAYPIKEIARMVGYRHSGHFTSKFKKRFGVLPKEYIKTMVQL
jgi:AraC-like DNA-binding protein